MERPDESPKIGVPSARRLRAFFLTIGVLVVLIAVLGRFVPVGPLRIVLVVALSGVVAVVARFLWIRLHHRVDPDR